MSTFENPRTTAEMMSDIMGHVSNLLRSEADLARAEISESLTKLKASLAAMAVSLVLVIVGLHVLAAALVAFVIEAGMEPHWASLIVGGALLVMAAGIFFSAKSALQNVGFMPTRSAQNVKRDAAAIKDSLNDT